MTSAHLDGIITKQHGSTMAFIVFVDVVKYSLRKSVMQQRVVSEFSKSMSDAINSISAKHVVNAQKQNLNFLTDIIKIPTGDGAAIVFPFQGIGNMHLDFALEFLNSSVSSRKDEMCNIFDKQGWCNCHTFYNVRIGVSEGKVIVFKDVNGNYNVAGGVVNMAARIMGLADGQQIIFTQDAYDSINDMTEDTKLEERFINHGPVEVKHGVMIEVCQYIGTNENYINREAPIQVKIANKQHKIEATNSIFKKSSRSMSPSETLESLEVLDILKDMPLPPGMEALFKGSSQGVDRETARALVEAFTIMNNLTQGKINTIIDVRPPVDNGES